MFLDALENERIRHDVIKDAATKSSVTICLARISEIVWKKAQTGGVRVRNQEDDSQSKEKRDPVVEKFK